MLQLLLLVGVLLALLVVLATCVFYFSLLLYRRWSHRHLPHPKLRRFVSGNALDMIECLEGGGHYAIMVSKWGKICGPVFVTYFYHRAGIFCLEPSIVRELLINTNSLKPKETYGTFQYLFGHRATGFGLFSERDHNRWEIKRKLLDPAFKREYLIDLMYQYNNSVQEFITYLSPKADGTSKILMADEFNKVAMDIIAKVAFSLNDEKIIADQAPLCSAAPDAMHGIISEIRNPYLRFDFRAEARGIRSRALAAVKMIRGLGRDCILKRLEDMKEGREYPQDILTLILQASPIVEKQMKYGLEDMVDEFVTFFTAGQETTAQLMSFTFENIGRHPHVYKKLQEEVDSVIGTKESITFEDIGKLEYMALVLKEVLRYTPPVAGVQRVVPHDLVINGYNIPAGCRVGVNHYAMGRDERFFDDPETFDPERFRGEDSNKRMYAYFPFSLGPRICIGQHFALIEAKVVIAKLLQVFDFTLVPGVELQFLSEVVIKPKNRTPIYLTPRKE